jgi:hypothetical protein
MGKWNYAVNNQPTLFEAAVAKPGFHPVATGQWTTQAPGFSGMLTPKGAKKKKYTLIFATPSPRKQKDYKYKQRLKYGSDATEAKSSRDTTGATIKTQEMEEKRALGLPSLRQAKLKT